MATAAQIRAFLDRPWARLRAEKDRHLAARIAEKGADEAFRLAASLIEHARAMGAVQTLEDERADLDSAIRLRKVLDRARGRSRRTR